MVNRATNRFSVLYLMLLGTAPQIALLAESMELGVHPRLWLWVLGAALCLWVSACCPRGLLLGMPASALLLYAAFRFFEASPLKELDDLVDKFSGALYTHYYAADGAYTYLNAVEDHSFLLLLIAYLLLAYLSSALTSRSGRRFMCFLGSVPLFAACLSVNGTPAYLPVVAMLLFWALVLTGGNYREDGGGGKTVFLFTLPILLLLTGILWLSRPAEYRIDECDLALSQQFDRLGEMLRHWFEENSEEEPAPLPGAVWTTPESMLPEGDALLWESTGGGMDLSQKCAPEMLEKLFFRVQAQTGGTLYLRGVSYGDYLGTGWESAPDAPVSSLGYAARALERAGERRSLAIQTLSPLRYALLPYYSELSGESDAYVLSDQQPEHLRYTVFSGSLDKLSQESAQERLYRDYAHEIYTRLPDETRSALLSLAASAGLDAASPGIVDEVAAYVRNAGVYDLDTEPYPSGDYALWFLTQAHRGCCVHFATAATALYRALGIPARITEGFLVWTERERYVDVRGENAHAWVEVYRDGIGWIPVEVTGQSGLQPLPEATETPLPSEEMQDRPRETANPQDTAEAQPDTAALSVGVIQPDNSPSASPEPSSFISRETMSILFPLALLLCAPFLWRRLIRAIWKRRIYASDPNRAASAIWKRAQRLSAFGGRIPPEIQNCAEKACFSAQGVREAEVQPCRALLDQMLEERYPQLPLHRRLLYRFVYGLK